MSGISPIGPHTTEFSTDGVVSSVQAEKPTAGQSYTPLWAVGASSSLGGFEQLSGLRLPRAVGDVTVLLAEISLNLEQSIDKAREKRGIAQLAAFASALSSHNTQGLARLAEVRGQAVARTEVRLQDVQAATAPLASARSEQNALIGSYKDQVQSLTAQLAHPDLTPAQRTALEGELSAARAGLAGALDEREAIDIHLAHVRIDSLQGQIDDIDAQLAAIDPESSEAKEARAVLDTKRGEKLAAQQQLQAFEAGPRTEVARNRFSESNFSALQAATQDLSNRLTGYRARHAESQAQLNMATSHSHSTTVRAAATLRAEQINSNNLNAMRDLGVEDVFEGIAESLDAIEGFALQRFRDIAVNQEARSGDRIQQIAFGILTVIGDLVTAVSRMDPNVYDPVATYPTTGSRFRLEV